MNKKHTQNITRDWIPVHMHYPPEMIENLRTLSFAKRETRSDLIRRAVAAYLKKEGMKVA